MAKFKAGQAVVLITPMSNNKLLVRVIGTLRAYGGPLIYAVKPLTSNARETSKVLYVREQELQPVDVLY